jgi:hypothetical protein
MMAAAARGQFTLAPNDEAAAAALLQNLRGGEPQIEFEHSPVAS